MIAPRRAARHLQIQQPIADAVAGDHFAHHQLQGGPAHRHGNAQLAHRTLHAVQMRFLVYRHARQHIGDFIDAVAKLQAAILDMHAGLAVRQITAIHIGDAAGGGAAAPLFAVRH